MSGKHTPTPWVELYRAEYGAVLVGADGRPVCSLNSGWAMSPRAENVEHIVRCVNAHDELVAALDALVGIRAGTDATHEDAYRAMFKGVGAAAWDQARAALARARGGA